MMQRYGVLRQYDVATVAAIQALPGAPGTREGHRVTCPGSFTRFIDYLYLPMAYLAWMRPAEEDWRVRQGPRARLRIERRRA